MRLGHFAPHRMLATMTHRLPTLLARTAALAGLLATTCVAAQTSTSLACTDFDAHVNEAWRAATELPADRPRIGSFDVLRRQTDQQLASALTDLLNRPAAATSPGLQALATVYRSAMDSAAIEARGLAAVAPLLAQINQLTPADLPTWIAQLNRLGIDNPLPLWARPDAKDARRYALYLGMGGLGLPDRDDYNKTDEASSKLKAAYREHARRLLRAASAPATDAQLDALLALEAALAAATPTREQRRDPLASYNPHTSASLQTLAPGFGWAALLGGTTGQPGDTAVVVAHPPYVQVMAKLLASDNLGHSPQTWQTYWRVRVLDSVAPYLPQALAQSHFDYHRTAQRGQRARPPRAEEVIQNLSGTFGGAPFSQALGELYTAAAFSPLAQQRAEQMVADIKAGMHARLNTLNWMSPATKARAREKLDAMSTKIGAPPTWPRFEGLLLHADDYAGNLLRAQAWDNQRRYAEVGQAVDRARWNTSAHTVNAFAASGNQIVFPAAILQPPFFDVAADDATNYGAIGMVIGHEITHHFDDRGRQFDSVGNLLDWWTAEDAAAYKARADRVAALYSSYEPMPGQPSERINGRATLGENLSDFGGIQIAFAGLQIALQRNAKTASNSAGPNDGLTPEQRFFYANAVIWRTKMQPEALLNQLRTGSHSPGNYRVLGPLSNMAEFAKAYGCKAGDKMVAADPIVVW
jgi:putative endopeptidase